MKAIKKLLPIFLISLFIIPQGAHAHLIGGIGLASGVTHPLFGLDHLLAMVAVGIVSTQIGDKAIWKVPATFVSFMLVGGLLAIIGVGMPMVETGIALSVLLLGALIALDKRIPEGGAMLCVAVFALFHGHAHGTEMPSIVHPTLYVIGFVLSTAVLHITGVLIGHYARKKNPALSALRYAGVGMSMAGFVFLAGI